MNILLFTYVLLFINSIIDKNKVKHIRISDISMGIPDILIVGKNIEEKNIKQ